MFKSIARPSEKVWTFAHFSFSPLVSLEQYRKAYNLQALGFWRSENRLFNFSYKNLRKKNKVLFSIWCWKMEVFKESDDC